jgi:hypothetical protein
MGGGSNLTLGRDDEVLSRVGESATAVTVTAGPGDFDRYGSALLERS